MEQTGRKISTEEIAVRLSEELDDFYNDDLISSRVYNKKRQYINILRAINHADRLICRDMTMAGSVIVYVPPDTVNIIFSENHRYSSQIKSDILSQTDLISRDTGYFLAKDQYLDVIGINDRYLYVFDQYPADRVQTTSRIKKLSEEDFMGIRNRTRNATTGFFAEPYFEDVREDDAYCYFIPDEGRLVLDKKFKTGSFLKFNARLMPGIVQMKDVKEAEREQKKWSIYNILAPHWALELMICEALLWLLPRSASNARALVERDWAKQKDGFETKKPGDSNVIVPHHSY